MSEPLQRMTVSQLIEQLQQYPDDLLVVVQSYEEGYDPVTHLDERRIRRTPDRQWYVGVYEKGTEQGEKVLLIASKYNRSVLDDSPDESDDA